MLPTSITAVAEIDDVLRCDPAPLIRFLAAGRHIWVPEPGRVVLWRDDFEEEECPSIPPAVSAYWRSVLTQFPELPYATIPGGHCLREVFVAALEPNEPRPNKGIVVDRLSALETLDEWIGVIRRTGAAHGADPDAVEKHLDAITAFLMNAVTWG